MDAKPMAPGELGRFVCVAHGGCLHRHRTITENGVWVRSPDPGPLNPGSHVYSSAHRDCYEQWAASEAAHRAGERRAWTDIDIPDDALNRALGTGTTTATTREDQP